MRGERVTSGEASLLASLALAQASSERCGGVLFGGAPVSIERYGSGAVLSNKRQNSQKAGLSIPAALVPLPANVDDASGCVVSCALRCMPRYPQAVA